MKYNIDLQSKKCVIKEFLHQKTIKARLANEKNRGHFNAYCTNKIYS